MEDTESNSSKIAATSTAVDTLAAGVANSLNFKPLENADVFFGFDKATLTPQAKMALDQIAQKALAQPRAVVELHGSTDRIGSSQHNLELSRRRVWAVQRYLVQVWGEAATSTSLAWAWRRRRRAWGRSLWP
jgi:OOP family OmpA-OmpF porin